jgi:hypothetical protein
MTRNDKKTANNDQEKWEETTHQKENCALSRKVAEIL